MTDFPRMKTRPLTFFRGAGSVGALSCATVIYLDEFLRPSADVISPLGHVEQIRVPVFVAGGKDDQNVEITQSKRLISALKKNHVPYETFLVSEEGHGMRHLANQVELYTRIEAFLNKNMASSAPLAASP